jgi:hypothetical protein
MKDPREIEKAEAWLGDAVLALLVRDWLLKTLGTTDGELQSLVTSNQFLSRFGHPTAVEAALGRLWCDHGYAAAESEFREKFLPEMIRHLRRQRPQLSGRLPANPEP